MKKKKNKEELNYVYGGLEEFDDFQEIRERELYEIKNILNNFLTQQDVRNSTETFQTLENLKLITDFLKNDLNMLQNINSAIITLTKKVEDLKKNAENLFGSLKLI